MRSKLSSQLMHNSAIISGKRTSSLIFSWHSGWPCTTADIKCWTTWWLMTSIWGNSWLWRSRASQSVLEASKQKRTSKTWVNSIEMRESHPRLKISLGSNQKSIYSTLLRLAKEGVLSETARIRVFCRQSKPSQLIWTDSKNKNWDLVSAQFTLLWTKK